MSDLKKVALLKDLFKFFPEKTSKEALDYFSKVKLKLTNPGYGGVYQAETQGVEVYKVLVNLGHKTWECTCQNEKPCIHIGALLYQILDELNKRDPIRKYKLAVYFSVDGFIHFALYFEDGQIMHLEESNIPNLKDSVLQFFEKKGFSLLSPSTQIKDFLLAEIEELSKLPDVVFLDSNHIQPLQYGGKIQAKQVWREKSEMGDHLNNLYPYGFRRVRFFPRFVFDLPEGGGYYESSKLIPKTGVFWISEEKPFFYHILPPENAQKYIFSCDLNQIQRDRGHPLYAHYEHALRNVIRYGPRLLLSLCDVHEKEKNNTRKIYILARIEIAYGESLDNFLDPKSPLYTISPKAIQEESHLPHLRGELVEHCTGKILWRNPEKELELLEKIAIPLGIPISDQIKIWRSQWKKFFEKILPKAKEMGVVVRVEESVLGIVKKPTGLLRIKEGNNIDWFSGQITSEDLSKEDLHEFLLAVRRKDEVIRLKSGRWVWVEGSQLANLLEILDSHKIKVESGGRIENISFANLAAIEAKGHAHLRTEKGTELALKKIRDFFNEPLGHEKPDPLFRGHLRPYQLKGFQFLLKLWRAKVGGILADDMGLGKTIQSIALMSYIKSKSKVSPRFLVICPVAALSIWEEEIQRFAPHLPTCRWHGAFRSLKDFRQAMVVITSYATFLRNSGIFSRKEWDVAFIDEAQFVKNEHTRSARALRKLKAKSVICLTGTPIENSVEELWAIFDLAFPGYLGSLDSFREEFGTKLKIHNQEKLAKLTRPFLLRRKKEEVLPELPEKEEKITKVPMTAEQEKVYEAALQKALEILQKPSTPIIEFLRQLNILRQIACHPYMEQEKADPLKSGKLRFLNSILDQITSSAQGVLVFSQFLKPLELFKEILRKHNISYLYLDGKTPAHSRQEMIKRFQEGEIQFFLISLRAGGIGLTLTQADMVIHLDPWWNPAVEAQATDRAHRIGQKNKVMVYKLISEKTVEEKVLELQQKKRKLFQELIEKPSKRKVYKEFILELLSK